MTSAFPPQKKQKARCPLRRGRTLKNILRRAPIRGESMSYINPQLQPKFESLSIDLKNAILERNVRINTMQDFIKVLGEIAEGK